MSMLDNVTNDTLVNFSVQDKKCVERANGLLISPNLTIRIMFSPVTKQRASEHNNEQTNKIKRVLELPIVLFPLSLSLSRFWKGREWPDKERRARCLPRD